MTLLATGSAVMDSWRLGRTPCYILGDRASYTWNCGKPVHYRLTLYPQSCSCSSPRPAPFSLACASFPLLPLVAAKVLSPGTTTRSMPGSTPHPRIRQPLPRETKHTYLTSSCDGRDPLRPRPYIASHHAPRTAGVAPNSTGLIRPPHGGSVG